MSGSYIIEMYNYSTKEWKRIMTWKVFTRVEDANAWIETATTPSIYRARLYP